MTSGHAEREPKPPVRQGLRRGAHDALSPITSAPGGGSKRNSLSSSDRVALETRKSIVWSGRACRRAPSRQAHRWFPTRGSPIRNPSSSPCGFKRHQVQSPSFSTDSDSKLSATLARRPRAASRVSSRAPARAPHRDLLQVGIVEPELSAVGDDGLLVGLEIVPAKPVGPRDRQRPVARSVMRPSRSRTACTNDADSVLSLTGSSRRK